MNRRENLLQAGAAAVKKYFRKDYSELADEALEFPSVWASTGSLSLDRVCSGRNPGGVPMGLRYGRMLHIAGEWSTGKSLILDHMFQSVLRPAAEGGLEGLAVCTETEGSRDPHFAQAIGLPLQYLVIQRPETFEKAFDMFIEWHNAVRQKDKQIPVLWGFDSLDSTQAEKAADKGLSESGGWHYGGGRSEALSAGLRKVAIICSSYPTSLVMLNQTRDNVGVMFGPKKRTPGGNPPHFYASLELMLKGSPRPDHGYVRTNQVQMKLSKDSIKRLGLYHLDDGAVVGRYITATCTKTKLAATLDTSAEFYIDFRRGIHKWEGLAERLMFEGKLKTAEDALTGFEMAGEKFETKKEWLNWLVRNQEVLDVPVPAVSSA